MDDIKKQKSYAEIFEDPQLSEREKYKYYTQYNPFALALKEEVNKAVVAKGLSAVMNDTKWLELQSAIDKLPFPPPYVEKLILDNKAFEEVEISDAPEWIGDWSPFYREGMSLFFAIEYLKVKPRYSEHIGRLVAPKIYDEANEFEQLLKELHIPFENDKGTYIIYGYK